VASNLKISISSAVEIREADQENMPPPKMGRPAKITKDISRNMARQFNIGVLRSLQDGQRMVQSMDRGQVHVRAVQRHMEKEV